MTPLQQLAERGQSVWIDYLSRTLRQGRRSPGLVEQGVVGVTSNPTIFQGAIAEGDAYDDQIRELSAEHDDPKEIFWQLAKDDIRDACDILRSVWDEGEGKDGWVSLEVDPNLAHDTEATKSEAVRLHALVDRPNLFIKIPATLEGLKAIEDTIANGHPGQRHADLLARAPPQGRRGLRPRRRALRQGRRRPAAQVASVASFFVSRVDTEADKRLDEIGGHDELKGKLAIANAKLAYQTYREVFMTPEWEALEAKGASQAALPVGVDVDQEQGVQGHGLRRGADRPRHGQHDAARARRGGPRPRRDPRRHAARGPRGGEPRSSTPSSPPASPTTRSCRRSSARASRSSPSRSRT